jgi:membrane protease subunit (stomatin/prohibitin family)
MFGKKKEGGLIADVIRCDEPTYLIWKWRPKGAELGNSARENSIRFGSTLSVKDGEVAVFRYTQKDGTPQEYIEGPFDKKIEAANFPILSSIMGAAFGGSSPFVAEVYFINRAGRIQSNFGTQVTLTDPDPQLMHFGVPAMIRGSFNFRIIDDYKAFITHQRLTHFDLEAFREQVRDGLISRLKPAVANAPQSLGISVIQFDRALDQINDFVLPRIRQHLEEEFRIFVTSVNISVVEVDKESDCYKKLAQVTKSEVTLNRQQMGETSRQNMQDMQRMNAANMEDMMRIQREELQRAQMAQTEEAQFAQRAQTTEAQHAQRMQTDSQNIHLHQLNQQTRVALAGADALGQMGAGGGMNMGGGGGGGMNPAAMMTGMMMGGAVGGQMAGMMGNMMHGINQPMQPPGGMGMPPPAQGMPPPAAPPPAAPPPGGMAPPPPAAALYNVAVNGQTMGPFDMNALAQMVQSGQLTPQSQVWKQGMSGWAAAETVQELAGFFVQGAPPPPPAPPPAP